MSAATRILVAGGVVGSREAVGPVKKIARRARHATGSEHGVDDHAIDGDSVAAHDQICGKCRPGGAFSCASIRKLPRVNYLGFLAGDDPRAAVFKRQCESAGSTFGFAVKGGEAEAFRLLDALASDQAGGESGRHRNIDVAPGEHHAFRRHQSKRAIAWE